MNIRILTPDLEATYALAKPQGTPKGAFSRFVYELGIDGCTVALEGAMERRKGVQASVSGNAFVETRK